MQILALPGLVVFALSFSLFHIFFAFHYTCGETSLGFLSYYYPHSEPFIFIVYLTSGVLILCSACVFY